MTRGLTEERAWQRGLTTQRYKAVDDLLYHNVEAFTGIPELFFSWKEPKKLEKRSRGIPPTSSPGDT